MARIPKFTRTRLASELVGTPGVDTGAGASAGLLATVAGETADVLQKRQEALDVSDANNALLDFQIGAREDFNKHKTTFAADPANKTEVFREQLTNRLNNTLSGITNSRVRQLVSAGSAGVIQQQSLKEVDWANTQRAEVAVANTEALINKSAISARNLEPTDFDGFTEVMNDLLFAVSTTAPFVVGSSEIAELNKNAVKSVKTGRYFGLLDDNPDIAVGLLENGFFDDVYDPKEITEFTKKAKDRFKNLQESRQIDVLAEGAATHQGLWESFKDGSLTLDRLEIQAQTPFVKELTDMWIKGNPATTADKADAVMELYGQYNDLMLKKPKKAAKEDYEDLQKFQTNIAKHLKRGNITQDKANFFLQKLAETASIKIKSEKGGGFFADATDKGFRTIYRWLARQGDKNDLTQRAEMFSRYQAGLGDVGKIDPVSKKAITEADVAERTIQQQKDVFFPVREQLKSAVAGDIVDLGNGPVKFMGFNPETGDIQLETLD